MQHRTSATKGESSGLVWSNYHLWLIIFLFLICVAVEYADFLGLTSRLPIDSSLSKSWYTAGRLLFLLTILHATFIFRLNGGLMALSSALLAMLPQAILFDQNKSGAVLEVVFVTLIGSAMCAWSGVRERERLRYRQLAANLAAIQEKLQGNVMEASLNARRLATINSISTALSRSLDPKKILDTAVGLLVEIMEIEIVLVYSCYEKAGKLVLMVADGIPAEAAQELDGIRVGEGFNGRVAETGEVMVVDYDSEGAQSAPDAIKGMGIQSQVIVPMKSKGRVIGTICVGMRNSRQFLPEEVDLLSTIAGQIASALENAYLYDGARRIADKLYKSERDYRSLFENAHDAIWFHNFDGIMLAANRATQKLTGYDVESLVGMNVLRFLSNNELQLARKVRQKLLAGETIEQPYEQKLMRKDGTIATVMLTSSLITFDGQPVGFQHIARDITDEMRMQDNLRFYLQQITQAQEEERKRIARELHDDTAQSLFAISRQIDNFMRSDSILNEQQLAFLQEMRQRIGDALQDVKRFSQDLRPPIIDDLGLLPAIQWLLKQIQDEHGVKSKLTVLGQERRFTPEVELILFRIVQEALSNAYRHARASKVEAVIEFAQSSICIMVSDNGKGFKVPDNFGDLSRSGKLGLLGMQERVSLLNGNIDVKSEPKKGTIVTVRASI